MPESQHSRDFRAEREKAKKLLSVLNDNKINYPDLVQEGLDPQILGELYNDLSISTQSEPVRMPDQFGSIMNLQPTNEAQPTESLSSRLNAKQGVPERSEPLPTSSQNINPQNIAVSTLQSQISSKALALNTTTQAKPVITANTGMNRNVPVKSAPSPIDRKDYIARLQAAKTGKQAAISKPTGHESLSATSNAATATGKNVQAQPDSRTSQTLAATDESVITAEKRKAQTELARQKMEALATRKTAPSTAVVSTEATPASLSRTSSFSSAMNTSEQDQVQSERQSLSRSSPSPPIHENSAAIPSTINQTSNQAAPSSGKLPSFGGIPGLFMTASPSTKPAQPQVTSISASRETSVPMTARNRKRPVASDFDEPEGLRQLANGFKRPFGQSRHDHVNEEMIIEVSDDETAGSGMDMDDDQDTPEPPAHLPNNGNHTPFRQSTIRNLLPVPDLPSRATSVKPAVSAVSTPPAVQTPGSLAHVEDLKKREEEIAALRRRIAEAERRKAMSKGKQTEASRAQTPTTTQRPVAEPVLSSPAAATAGTALKNVARSISSTAPVLAPSLPSTTSTETHIPRMDEKATMCLSVSNPTQWKKIRRAEIESGLPSLDASLASNAARLEQLRKEVEQLEAENRKRMRDKENLIKELESLGIDTEGMPHEELQAKKDEIVQQRENETTSFGEGKSNPISFNSPLSLGLFSGPSTHSHLNNTAQDAHAITISEIQTNLPVSGKEDEEVNCMDIASTGNNIDGQVEVPARENVADESAEDRADEVPDNISEASGDAMEMSDIESDKHDDLYTATNLPSANTESFEAAVSEKEPVAVAATASPIPSTPPQEDDAEDFYSPEPVVAVSAEGKVEQIEVPQGAHVSSNRQSVDMNFEEGEIEMSESSSDEGEDYEPIDTAPEPQEIFRTGSEDDYEPSDALPEFSPPAETESMQSSRATSPENKSLPPSADVPNIATADDLAPKLQPQTEPDTQGSITQPVCFPFPEMHGTNALSKIINKHTLIEHPRFVPYESPLRKFKSYRYHPEYSKDVSGGFRSMTYSHQIDPEKPICRFEAAGGTCNDDECDSQHFRGMGLDGAS